MNKVIDTQDNDYGFDNNKLIKTLVLKYTNPLVSVSFVAKNENDLVREELCKRANLVSREDNFYINGQLITKELQKQLISEELVHLAKEDLNNDNNDLYLGGIIKNILKDMTIKHIDKDKFLLTEADLIKGLYGIEEGSKTL